MTERKRQLNKL